MRISDWSSDVCSSDLARGNRAWIFAHLAHGSRARAKDLHRRAFRPFRQSDLARQSAPVGESTNLRIPVAAIVGRHILRPLARQRADKPAIVAEVVAAVMELHPVAVPRQRHIGRMARSEEHTSELQSLMRTSYAVFCLNKK